MKDIMIDLETMDNIGNATIVAIGAIECDLVTGKLGDKLYRIVDLKGQIEKGLSIDPDTVYWWLQQSEAARQELVIDGKVDMLTALEDLNDFLVSRDTHPENQRLWGNGASFDNSIIRTAAKAYGVKFPIPFWQDRDMRTIVGFYPPKLAEEWRNTNRRTGEHHNALADCKHQINYCSHILQELGVKELY